MFPDLWTSSNLLKMTFSLHTETEQTVRSSWCYDVRKAPSKKKKKALLASSVQSVL